LPQIASPGRVRLPDLPAIPEQYALLERKAGANGHDRIDARGNRHEDMVNTVSAVIAMLATPLSGAEGWMALIDVWGRGERWGGGPLDADVDDIRPAGEPFNWSMTSAPLLDVIVPSELVTEGRIGAYTMRRIGDKAVVSMTCAEAAEWLRNPVWRQLNPELAKKLLGESALSNLR
jgi:hypothetical protein